jgi:hypothetical protein
MHAATASNRIDRPQMPATTRREGEDPFLAEWARENRRLAQENEILRQTYAELTTAAESWIRLYELALSRANAAEAAIAAGNHVEGLKAVQRCAASPEWSIG